MELPNLDCMEPDDLDILAETFHLLEKYALLKRDAMLARLSGHVDTALDLERECDKVYKDLPANARW